MDSMQPIFLFLDGWAHRILLAKLPINPLSRLSPEIFKQHNRNPPRESLEDRYAILG
jgi:hypothetical protein